MSTFWKIEESVNRSHYITLEGIYDTELQALTAMRRERNHERMRVAPYETGGWHTGPIRMSTKPALTRAETGE